MEEGKGIVGVYIEKSDGSTLTVSDKAFLNEINNRTETAKVFDSSFSTEMGQINDLANEVIFLLAYVRKHRADIDEVRQVILGILLNALNTYLGCILLLRAGLAIQEEILYRNLLESVSSVLFLFFNGDKLGEFKKGNIKSHDTISSAKIMFPAYGKFYGELTNKYAHIGESHHEHLPIFNYHEYPEDSAYVFSHAKSMLWLLYVVSELAFYDASQRKYYWDRVEEYVYQFTPYPKALEGWRKLFFGDIPEELTNETIGNK